MPAHQGAELARIRATVEGVAARDLAATAAWHFGLAFLRDGYFWEAHEVLEAVWLALPPNSAERVLCQGLIQLANAGLKRVMQRDNAAARLRAIADDRIAEGTARGGLGRLGLDPRDIEGFRRAAG
ncbi:MAG: DUF309 domain-containing protein [Minwuia sp.]|nr:DUF309 domain-containing protein [Minwuia sp.]